MYRLAAALALTTFFAAPAGEPPFTSHWPAEGSPLDIIHEVGGELYGGTAYVPARVGQGFSFDGVDDAVNLPDDPRLAFTRSVTIRAWVKCNSYPPQGQDWGLIVFRGDDQPGRDPYFLGVDHGGGLTFGIDGDPEGARVAAPFPLGQFVRVTATLDHATGLMRLLYGDRVVAETVTTARPARTLNPDANAGIGIGNHSSQPRSQYNMPFHGVIDELTLSNRTTLALESLTLGPANPRGTLATINLAAPAPPEGARVRLACQGASAQAEVTIPAHRKTATVLIPVSPDETRVTVTATFNGSTVSASRGTVE